MSRSLRFGRFWNGRKLPFVIPTAGVKQSAKVLGPLVVIVAALHACLPPILTYNLYCYFEFSQWWQWHSAANSRASYTERRVLPQCQADRKICHILLEASKDYYQSYFHPDLHKIKVNMNLNDCIQCIENTVHEHIIR